VASAVASQQGVGLLGLTAKEVEHNSVAGVGNGRQKGFVVDFDVKLCINWKCITRLVALAIVAFGFAVGHEIQTVKVGLSDKH
tara:strand:- start:2616 stop:2864 length:249 start_codon:yes stop_codon:yes gene_type:complete